MKKLLVIYILSLLANSTFAQQFTLPQSVDYALKNQESLKNLDIDRQLAEKKISEAYTTLFPQIKGVLDVRDNFVLPTSVIPAAAFGGPDDSFRAVKFGQKYNGTAALDATWTLYDPSFYPSLKAQKLSTGIAENSKRIQESTIVLNVNRAYYSVLLSKERITLAENILEKNKKVFEDTKVLFENNQVQELDLTKAKINYDNQLPEAKRAKQLYEQSLYMLKYQMGYPIDSALMVLDTLLLTSLTNSTDLIPEDSKGFANRPEYKNLIFQQNQEKLFIRKYRMSYLPTVSLYGYAGAQAFRPTMDLFSGTSTWYGVSYLGFRVALPVFDGTLKHVQTQESKLSLKKKENELNAFKKQYAYELKNTKINVENALFAIDIKKRNQESAEASLKVIQDRYTLGLASLKEVIEAKNLVMEMQVNYFNSLYDYIAAKLEYDKVMNKL